MVSGRGQDMGKGKRQAHSSNREEVGIAGAHILLRVRQAGARLEHGQGMEAVQHPQVSRMISQVGIVIQSLDQKVLYPCGSSLTPSPGMESGPGEQPCRHPPAGLPVCHP